MLDLEALLGTHQYNRLMRGIARSRYQVLLGAGASASSQDRYGNRLPSGYGLRDDIASAFGLPAATDKSLKRVYQLAQGRTANDGRSMQEYLQDRFTGAQPAPWYNDLLSMQWDGLWTLNIDDCVERAANSLGANRRQEVVSISWTDRHRQADQRRDEVLLIHLHGKASRAKRDDELIFDISSYVNALTSQHRWLKIFGDEFPAKPFIIVGASLDEEIDLQGIIEEGRPFGEHPSIIVLRSIDDFQFGEYQKYGLTPVRATAEDFFSAVKAALPAFIDELAPDENQQLSNAPTEAIRFLGQWRRMSLSGTVRRDERHDLYLGHEPRWSDALAGRISHRDLTNRLVRDLTASRAPGQHAVSLLTGESFSGKSTIFLAVAHKLIGEGYEPHVFSKEEAFDREAIKYWLRRYPRSVLLLDSASDFAYDVADLLEDLEGSDLTLRLLLVERDSRADHLRYQLSAFDYDQARLADRLTNSEVNALIDLLEKKRRLGVLTTMSKSQRASYFSDHDRKLFSSMAELEDGRGFHQRVRDEFDSANSSAAKNLLAVVGLASRLGYALPLDIVKTASGLTAAEVDQVVRTELGDILVIENAAVSARHRIFGELLLAYLPKEMRKDAIVRLALAVAPHVSPVAISMATIYYRLVRALMGRALLLEILDQDHLATLAVFSQIEDAYSWNARFWEQRALIGSDAEKYEQAFSWAQQGVATKSDARSLTTLGVVLMQRALHEAEGGLWPTDWYERAEEQLADARRLEGTRAEYPIDTFFRYTMRLVDAVPKRDAALNGQLKTLWQNWYSSMLTLETVSQNRLDRIRREAAAAWVRAGFGSH